MSSVRIETFQWNFRKDVTYDNINSHQKKKKAGLHPLSLEDLFLEKPRGGQFNEMSFLSMQMSFLTTSVR